MKQKTRDTREIIVKTTDKNLGRAITSKDWYVNECYRQLNDPTTYRAILSTEEVEADIVSRNDTMIKPLRI